MLGFSGLLSGEAEAPAAQPTRGQLISQILEANPTATNDFLASFSDDALRDYLEHLLLAQEPRGRSRAWTRRDGVPAIVSRGTT